jgi:Heme exporter protein D (CcmD)
MNHWSFILAAYGVTALGSIAVFFWSYRAMRRAEARAEDLGRDR